MLLVCRKVELQRWSLQKLLWMGFWFVFENIARKEHGSIDGDKAVRELYRNAVDVNGHGEYLTESGKLLVDELIAELVGHAKKIAATTQEHL